MKITKNELKQIIKEALMEELGSKESIEETIEELPIIPAPYDKYFEVIDPKEIDFVEGMYKIGDKVRGNTILAYLGAKDGYIEYFDSDAFLTDNPDKPVVEIVHDRCYPIDVEEVFGEVVDEACKKG